MRRRAKPEAAYSQRPIPGGSGSFLVGGFGGDDSGLFLVLRPVALALDVDGGRVMQ
jgi:hypothetical protein